MNILFTVLDSDKGRTKQEAIFPLFHAHYSNIMGKSKNNKSFSQPNAPDFQQILLNSPIQQPPHNPYYQDLHPTTNFVPPPPSYSDISTTVPAKSIHTSRGSSSMPNANYQQLNSANMPRQGPIIIHQTPIHYDRRADKYHNKVRKFNTEIVLVALLAIGLSVYAYNLFGRRPCINFVVHQPSKDFTIHVNDVRDAHIHVIYFSAAVLLLALVKAATGRSKSYGCYLFLVGLISFLATLHTGYLAYLAYYTPCTLNGSQLVSGAIKSAMSVFDTSLPAPDKRLMGEKSVFDYMDDDKNGVIIFFMDLFNFILYLSAFVSSTLLC